MQKEFRFLTEEEYEGIFEDFCTFRQKIAGSLLKFGLMNSRFIMDLAAGHGFLSFAINDQGFTGKIIDIGLLNDLDAFKRTSANAKYSSDNIDYIVMDSSKLAFRASKFDLIINFLGLEDINMTLGKNGVILTLFELARIVRKKGILEIAIMVKGNEPSSILNWEIWDYIGLNSVFYLPKFYIKHLNRFGYRLEHKFLLKSFKKMNEEQAIKEISFACEEAPRIFKNYDVKAKDFEDVWNKYGMRIKKFGLGFYPDILVMVFKKIN